MIEALTAFLKGPLFVFSIVVALLGVFRLVFLHLRLIATAFYNSWRYNHKNSHLAKSVFEKATSIDSFKTTLRGASLFWGLVGFAVVLLIFFSIDHVTLMERRFGLSLFAMSRSLGAFLVLFSCVSIIVKLWVLSGSLKKTVRSDNGLWLWSLLLLIVVSGAFSSSSNYPPLLKYARFLHLCAADLFILSIPFSRVGHFLVLPLANVTTRLGIWLMPDAPKRDETAAYFKKLSEKHQ